MQRVERGEEREKDREKGRQTDRERKGEREMRAGTESEVKIDSGETQLLVAINCS